MFEVFQAHFNLDTIGCIATYSTRFLRPLGRTPHVGMSCQNLVAAARQGE